MEAMWTDPRQQRGAAIVKASASRIKEVVDGVYVVPSQSHGGTYVVRLSGSEQSCTCPDHESHGTRCKHIFSVLIVRHEIVMPDGTSVVVSEKKFRPTYPQDWPRYRQARMNEKDVFQRLLRSLCAGIEQPPYKGNGCPALPLSDVIFSAVLKTWTTLSSDRAHCDVVSAKKDGFIEVAPHPNTVLRVMRMPDTVPLLRRLIEQSAMPLRLVEVDFAADATGVGTKSYARWYDHKWGKERKEKKWLKLNAMVGVKTMIISACDVTTGNKHESDGLPALLKTTAKIFPRVGAVSADLGYLSHENLAAIDAIGANALIPFEPRNKPSKWDPLWTRLLAYFRLNEQAFREEYHKRSLSESTFSSMKRVLSHQLRAKEFPGQVGELYARVLAHNIRMLVHAIYELGIDATFWQVAGLP